MEEIEEMGEKCCNVQESRWGWPDDMNVTGTITGHKNDVFI